MGCLSFLKTKPERRETKGAGKKCNAEMFSNAIAVGMKSDVKFDAVVRTPVPRFESDKPVLLLCCSQALGCNVNRGGSQRPA